MKFYEQHTEIFFNKDISSLQTEEGLDLYSPYMVNKYASLKDPYWCMLVNYSTNKYWPVLQDKVMHAKCLVGILPKEQKSFIAYPFKKKDKKSKMDAREYDEKIKMLAKAYEISEREVEDYVERLNIDLTKLIPN